jgi:hypothetical protein
MEIGPDHTPVSHPITHDHWFVPQSDGAAAGMRRLAFLNARVLTPNSDSSFDRTRPRSDASTR